MKRIFLATLAGLLIFTIASAQENLGEIQKLNQQMTNLFQAGKLDESVSIAEQIVKLQRAEKFYDSQNLITALENLAQIKLTRLRKSSSDLAAPNLKPNEARIIAENLKKDGTETEVIYREILNLAQENRKVPTEQLVGVKTSLAWLLYNFFPAEANIPIGFDKQTKDKFDSLSRARFYKRINEAETFYTEALKNSEDGFGEQNELTMLTHYKLAEFQLAMGNLESAIAHYEKCIAAVEKKLGKSDQNLLLPLESYLKALAATGQEDPAFEVLSRIVQISKKSAQFPKSLLNLSLRADKAFISNNSPEVERRQQEINDNAYMNQRSAIITSGIRGSDAAAATLGASTQGKLYYENSNEIRIIRIPVKILVDETGNVVEAEGLTKNKDYQKAAEKIVKEWKFRPFEGGKPSKLKGYVECLFLAEKFVK